MTSHLQRRMQTELALPTDMPGGGDFAAAAQSTKNILLHALSQAQYAKLHGYRTGMPTEIIYFQYCLSSTGNFKSP